MPQGALDEPGVHASFEQMGSVRMAKGMNGHACFGNAGPVCGCAEGALDTGPTPGGGRRRTVWVIPPGGGKEPGRVTMGFPVGAEQSEGLFGQGDVAVFGALPAVDMDLEALAVDIGDLKGEGSYHCRVSGLLEHRSGADGPQCRLFGSARGYRLWAAAHRERWTNRAAR